MGHDHTPVRCIIFGAGGHAAVVIEALRAYYLAIELIVLDPTRLGETVLDIEVSGGDELVASFYGIGFKHFAVGVGSVGTPTTRTALYRRGIKAGLSPLSIVHPSANVSPSATLGMGVQILAGSIVGPRAVVGNNVIINHRAVVDHDCIIGDHSHIAIGATLSGSIRVGEGVHVGAGATILQSLEIQRLSIVGAGAVVTKSVKAGETVVGVPAAVWLRNAAVQRVGES